MGEQLGEGLSTEINITGCYDSVCVELDIASMPVNTLLHVFILSHRLEGWGALG